MRNNHRFRFLKITLSIGMIIIFGLIVRRYSKELHLFDNINVNIKGNQFVNTQRIQEEITPFLNQSLLTLSLKNIQSKSV